MTRPFEGVFGNTCELRLLEYLLPLDGIEFNVTELSEEVGVSRVTVGRVVKKFVEWGLLNASDEKITQYSINPSSPLVRSIEVMNNALIGQMLGDEKTEEIRVHLRKHVNEACSPEVDIHDRSVWSYMPEMTEPMALWKDGETCINGVSDPFSQTFPHATADDYCGYPEYIQ